MSDQLAVIRKTRGKIAGETHLFHIQLREAREQGLALRTIAEAAGMSYETVRRICES